MKNLLLKVKSSKKLILSISAVGSIMIGLGAMGLIMSPSYVYSISGIETKHNSQDKANAWVESNITEVSTDSYEIGNGVYISASQLQAYITGSYKQNFGENTNYFMSSTPTVDSNGKISVVTGVSSLTELVYKSAANTGLTKADAVDSWLKQKTVYKNAYSTDAFNTHYETEALAIQAWKDRKTDTHTYGNRSEYKYEGTNWELTVDAAKNAKTELNGTTNRQEYMYTGTSWFTSEDEAKDAKVTLNGTTSRVEYMFPGSGWNLTVEAAKDERVNQNTYTSVTEYRFLSYAWSRYRDSAKSAAESAEYAKISCPNGEDNSCTYNGTVYATSSIAMNAAFARVTASETTRELFSYDNTNFTYNSEIEAKAAYRATLVNAASRTRYAYNGVDFSYDSEAEAKAAYRATLTAATTRTRYSYNGTAFNYDSETAAKAAYKATLGNAETRTRYSHDGTNFNYDTLADAKAAYKATLTDDSLAEAATVTFYYSDNGLSVAENKSETTVRSQIESKLSSKNAIVGETVSNFDQYTLTQVYKYKDGADFYNTEAAIIAKYTADNFANMPLVQVTTFKLNGTDATFATREAAIKFWNDRIEKVKA